jgi:hypothetical protein
VLWGVHSFHDDFCPTRDKGATKVMVHVDLSAVVLNLNSTIGGRVVG